MSIQNQYNHLKKLITNWFGIKNLYVNIHKRFTLNRLK